MDRYQLIREMWCVKGMSQRQIARELGISRNTVKRYCEGEAIPGEACPRNREKPVITEEIKTKIEGYLLIDQGVRGKKQRHTAQRVYARLVEEEGFAGSYSAVATTVRDCRGRMQEAYVPLVWDVGEAIQVDWGEAWFKLKGQETKCQLFCMRLCHSCMPFVMAFPAQRLEFLTEGHRKGFEFFNGVARRLIYDNMRTLVKEGWGRNVKKPQAGLLLLQAHYAYTGEFCNPGKGNEKGLVESLVGWIRRNVLVPVPEIDSWGQLNEQLLKVCNDYRNHRIRGRMVTVGEAFEQERLSLTTLPARPLDTSRTETMKVGPDGLIRFDSNHYSVPVRLIGEHVTAKGYAYMVHVYRCGKRIAEHERKFKSNEVEYDLKHYIDLLMTKPRAARQAAPVRQTVPECIQQLRDRLPEGAAGDKEFVNILRLIIDYGIKAVTEAVQLCGEKGQYRYEVIRFELLQRIHATHPTTSIPTLDALGVEVHPVELGNYDNVLRPGVVICG